MDGDDPGAARLAGGVQIATILMLSVPMVLAGGLVLYVRRRTGAA